MGRPNVGKSTLLNAFLGEPIAITSPLPQTTRDSLLGIATYGPTQFLFIDTPGIHAARHRLGKWMNEVVDEECRTADVIVFVTEVPSRPPQGPFALTQEERRLLEALPSGVPVLCVLNKIDRAKEKERLFPILQALQEAHPFEAIIPVSARRADGPERILREIEPRLPLQPKLFQDDELSDKPVRYFVGEFVREQILHKTHSEVPHGVAVVVERFDEAPKVPRIDIAIHVDKESHKPILIGAGGSLLKAVGTDARARVEDMLGRQVRLQLWVRVTPGWYEKESSLRDMGYALG